VGMRGGPDRLQLFLARHAVDRTRLMSDDRCTHGVWTAFVGEIAEAVIPKFATADPDREEDAGDIAGLIYGHAEHAGSLEERRQKSQHEVVLAGRDFEPFRRVWDPRQGIDTWRIAMAVEEGEHLLARCDAFEHL